MAKFEAIQEDGSNITFAKYREDGSLIIQNRYYDPIYGGFAGMDEVNLSPKGVQKLLKLLSECSLTMRAADAPKAAVICTCSMEDGIHEWNCALNTAHR